jgi:hypothetical protein
MCHADANDEKNPGRQGPRIVSREETQIKHRLLKGVFIGGLAAMALMLAIPTRAQSPGPQKAIVRNDSPAIDSESSVEATKQAPVLIAWIVTQTDWAILEVPPIRLIPSEEIQKLFTAEDPTGFNIEAFFSEKDHTVYLVDSWQPNNLRDRSILLHELAHHLQYLNGVKATCPGEFEWQAIHLQVDWLRQQGVEDPIGLLGMSPLILMLSQCDEMSS